MKMKAKPKHDDKASFQKTLMKALDKIVVKCHQGVNGNAILFFSY